MDKHTSKILANYVYDIVDDLRIERIESGTKIMCNAISLKKITGNEDINKKFNLTVRRKNRWWYSIYFADKVNRYQNF